MSFYIRTTSLVLRSDVQVTLPTEAENIVPYGTVAALPLGVLIVVQDKSRRHHRDNRGNEEQDKDNGEDFLYHFDGLLAINSTFRVGYFTRQSA